MLRIRLAVSRPFALGCRDGMESELTRIYIFFSVREFVQFAKSKEVDDIVDGYA
jgi:hypothetical protein